jgi:hypothetical protein
MTMPRLCGQNMRDTANDLFGAGDILRIFAKPPKSSNMPSTIEVDFDYLAANMSSYCTDRILLIDKADANGICDYYFSYCVFGEIEGLDPVTIPSPRL